MTLTLYEATVPSFIKGLKALQKILAKGQAKDETLTSTKLIDDMGDLCFQIQRLSDTSKGLAVRIGKAEPVAMEDNEKTFPELIARLEKTITVLEGLSPTSMDAQETSEVVMKTGRGEMKWDTGKDYVLTFAIPNFYFHMSMTYALLRKGGVDIGKGDFLGRV